MGYPTKSFRRKQQQRIVQEIAIAALSGCVFEYRGVSPALTGLLNRAITKRRIWGVVYPDGQTSHNYSSRVRAARAYMNWYLHPSVSGSTTGRWSSNRIPDWHNHVQQQVQSISRFLREPVTPEIIEMDYAEIDKRVLAWSNTQ